MIRKSEKMILKPTRRRPPVPRGRGGWGRRERKSGKGIREGHGEKESVCSVQEWGKGEGERERERCKKGSASL
jgi:hypothetical protein